MTRGTPIYGNQTWCCFAACSCSVICLISLTSIGLKDSTTSSLAWFKRKKCSRTPYFMGTSKVSCKFSLKPIKPLTGTIRNNPPLVNQEVTSLKLLRDANPASRLSSEGFRESSHLRPVQYGDRESQQPRSQDVLMIS